MENDRKYCFVYNNQLVWAESRMMFRGEYFDLNGNRHYKESWPCTFKYVEDGKFYIEVDGKLYYHKKLNYNSIWYFIELNGKKIPNPVTEDDVKAGSIFLIFVMAVTSIFKGAIVLWIIELIGYFSWAKQKKYPY